MSETQCSPELNSRKELQSVIAAIRDLHAPHIIPGKYIKANSSSFAPPELSSITGLAQANVVQEITKNPYDHNNPHALAFQILTASRAESANYGSLMIRIMQENGAETYISHKIAIAYIETYFKSISTPNAELLINAIHDYLASNTLERGIWCSEYVPVNALNIYRQRWPILANLPEVQMQSVNPREYTTRTTGFDQLVHPLEFQFSDGATQYNAITNVPGLITDPKHLHETNAQQILSNIHSIDGIDQRTPEEQELLSLLYRFMLADKHGLRARIGLARPQDATLFADMSKLLEKYTITQQVNLLSLANYSTEISLQSTDLNKVFMELKSEKGGETQFTLEFPNKFLLLFSALSALKYDAPTGDGVETGIPCIRMIIPTGKGTEAHSLLLTYEQHLALVSGLIQDSEIKKQIKGIYYGLGTRPGFNIDYALGRLNTRAGVINCLGAQTTHIKIFSDNNPSPVLIAESGIPVKLINALRKKYWNNTEVTLPDSYMPLDWLHTLTYRILGFDINEPPSNLQTIYTAADILDTMKCVDTLNFTNYGHFEVDVNELRVKLIAEDKAQNYRFLSKDMLLMAALCARSEKRTSPQARRDTSSSIHTLRVPIDVNGSVVELKLNTTQYYALINELYDSYTNKTVKYQIKKFILDVKKSDSQDTHDFIFGRPFSIQNIEPSANQGDNSIAQI
jgi:hypothetical protein